MSLLLFALTVWYSVTMVNVLKAHITYFVVYLLYSSNNVSLMLNTWYVISSVDEVGDLSVCWLCCWFSLFLLMSLLFPFWSLIIFGILFLNYWCVVDALYFNYFTWFFWCQCFINLLLIKTCWFIHLTQVVNIDPRTTNIAWAMYLSLEFFRRPCGPPVSISSLIS